MKSMKLLASMLPFALIAACAGGGASSSGEMTEIRNYRLAQDIANNCGRYETTMEENTFYTSIDEDLMGNGYTAQQAQDMITAERNKPLNDYRADFYASLNVDPSNGMSYCTLGDRTRAARPDVGDYLVPVNPSN